MRKIYGVTTATPLSMGKVASKVAEPLLRSEELYNHLPTISYSGGDDYHRLITIHGTLPVDLKTGETYVFSIVAPKIGASVRFGNLGVLNYVGDRYTAKLTLKNDITTLESMHLTFDRNSPDDEVNINKIIIEKKAPIREKFDDIEAQIGNVETALDGIIALQENLIGGGN